MKRHTRKLILNIATGIALAATAAVVLAPALAVAAPATTTSNVNVRSGPGPSFSVVDTLRSGTRVDVGQCRGDFCQITSRGVDGWVSASFLSRGGNGGGGGGTTVIGPTNPGLGINIGPGGITIGTPAPPVDTRPGRPGRPDFDRPGRPRPPVVAPTYEACFFDRSRLRGDSFCMEEGDARRDLGNWANRISSIDNPDGLEVRVCYERNFRDCRTYTTSASSLGDYDQAIQSIQIR